jgi:DNA-binding response OmpR family regulator
MKPRVLLMDESRASRLLLTAALRRRGYDVIAVSALEELEAGIERRPDLYLIDVQLGDVYGNDLVPWLRDVRRVDRPILLCSSRSHEELVRIAEECGADGVIRKNGRPDEVAALVDRHLSGDDL